MASSLNRGRTHTVEWKIENFTMFSQIESAEIPSPDFTLQLFSDSKFSILCFPNGDNTEGYISMFLSREDVKGDGPKHIDVGYEFSIITADGLDDFKRQATYVFPKAYVSNGYKKFANRKRVLSNKGRYLPRNTLTIRCVLWRPPPEKLRGTHGTARTTVSIQTMSLSWEIPKIIDRSEKARRIVPSMTQDLFELNAYMTSQDVKVPYRMGKVELDTLRIDVRKLLSMPKSLYLKSRICILDEMRKQWYLTEGEHIFCAKDELWLHPLSVEKNELLKKKESFLPDDILTLQCEFTLANGLITYQNVDSVLPRPKVPSKGRSLLQDLKSLYKETLFWDLLITVGDVTFPTQRWLLSARSRVLKAAIRNMLQMHLSLGQERIKEEWNGATSKDRSSDSSNETRDGSEDMKVDACDALEKADKTSLNQVEEEEKKSGPEDGIMEQDVGCNGLERMEVDTHSALVNTEKRDLEPVEDNSKMKGKESGTHRTIETEVEDLKCRPKSDYLHRGKVLIQISPTTTETLDVDYYFSMFDSGVNGINIAGPNILEIRNIEEDTFKELLKFIYLGKVEGLNFVLAKKLYMVAHEFQIAALKKRCVRLLNDNVTMKNVYETLILANAYRDKEVKVSAYELLFANMEYALLSSEWQDFAEQHIQLSDEALRFLRYKRLTNISENFPPSIEIVDDLLQ